MTAQVLGIDKNIVFVILVNYTYCFWPDVYCLIKA